MRRSQPLIGRVLAVFLVLVLPMSVSLATAVPALAQSGGKGPFGLTRDETAVVIDIIRDVLGDGDYDGSAAPGAGKGGMPPGLAKRDRLPPGLERQVRETGSLPPGLQKRLVDGIEARLPGKAVRVERDNVIVLDRRTGTVLDVIRDVLDIVKRS